MMYAKSEEISKYGCNALIEAFKESVPIGSPMRLKSARTASFGGAEFNSPKIFILLKKGKYFATCGVKLANGKYITECFPYHEILRQHGQVGGNYRK